MEGENKKTGIKYHYILAVIESVILAIGVLFSITETTRVIKYDVKHIIFYAFALLGVLFIAVLILLIKKRFVWLIGIALIVVYLIAGGYGAIVCEFDYANLKRLAFYEDKNITAEFDGNTYNWDRERYYVKRRDLICVEDAAVNNGYKLYIDGEKESKSVYTKPDDEKNIYVEVYGGGTGLFLILSPEGD